MKKVFANSVFIYVLQMKNMLKFAPDKGEVYLR